MLVCTLVALIIANSPLADHYERLVETRIGFVLSGSEYTMRLRHWVNDGLMALFFFILGLEIKRELLIGELREPSRALPVIAAAAGGMLVPALLFYALNQGGDTLQGWAIPMATDTAFAIGILALLGTRLPAGLTTFLLALAMIDDMGAVLVIALFYSDAISLATLAVLAPGRGRLPEGMQRRHLLGLGLLGGMGFTMSIFIAGLGFAEQPELLVIAKTGILAASLIAGLGGYLWLRFACRSSLDR